jgi:tetratricopeptide (TPR) repeat protein
MFGWLAWLQRVWPRNPIGRWVLPACFVLLGWFAYLTADNFGSRSGTVGAAVVLLFLTLVIDRRIKRVDEAAERRGLLLRLLEPPLRSGDVPPEGWAQLIDPRRAVSRFVGRARDEKALSGFLQRDAPLVAVVEGPPWCGKTRLLAQWASELDDPWVTGWVVRAKGGACVEAALAAGVPTVLLLDGFSSDLVEVLEGLGASSSGARVVVSTGNATALSSMVARASASAGVVCEQAWVWRMRNLEGRSDLERWYPAMVRTYAQRLRRPSIGLDRLPLSRGSDPSMGLLNATALAAVVGQQTWGRNPSLSEVLGVLWKSLVQSWDSTRHESRWGIQSLGDAQLEAAVIAACLTRRPLGVASPEIVGSLQPLRGYGEGVVANLCRWVDQVSDSTMHTATEAVLLPLSAFLGWSEHDQALFLQTTGVDPKTAAALLENVIPAARLLPGVGRLVGVLVGNDAARLRVAVESAMRAGVFVRDVDLALARAVASCKLERPQAAELQLLLEKGVCPQTSIAVQQRLIYWLRDEGDSPGLALSLTYLAVDLAEVGRRREALEPARESVDIRRRLADPDTGDPDAYEPLLALSLSNLANSLSEVGRRREALEPARESVDIRRRLADPDTGNPDAHEPGLALSLTNLGVSLSKVGRRQEALDSAQEAVAIYRRQSRPDTGNPDAYEPGLALSLTNVAIYLSEVGRPKEAVDPAQEAVGIRRRLADPDTGNPDAYEPDLALSLTNLAVRLAEVGRPKEALDSAQEAVAIYRRLADPNTGNPEVFRPKLIVAEKVKKACTSVEDGA